MNFYTLFTRTENVHLLKDVGMIPEKLAQNYPDVNSFLVTYQNGDYPYVGHQINNLKMVYLNKRFGKIIDGIRFIRQNADVIDVLNIYHLNLSSFFYCKAAKKYLNKNAVIYLKLDANNTEIEKLKKHDLRALIKRKTIDMADIVSAETTSMVSGISALVNKQIQWIPNGCYEMFEDTINSNNKKNRIITVGRLGAPEKNTKLLIDSFVRCSNNQDWELRLIGPFTDEIAHITETLKKEHPQLAERIILTGEITDKNILSREYREAKVFMLPSKWESFSFALAEALEAGLYIISSGSVPLAKDVIEFGAKGKIIEGFDDESWSNALLDVCNSDTDWEEVLCVNKAIVKEKYNWDTIVEKLYNSITELY